MTTLLSITKKIIPAEKISTFSTPWFWISVAELVIITILIYKLKSKSKKYNFSDLETENIRKSKKSDIDMDNLMNSIHNSRPLYKELCKKCHPDKFINDSKQEIAEEIFQEITKNERNFQKLELLKVRAINELKINF